MTRTATRTRRPAPEQAPAPTPEVTEAPVAEVAEAQVPRETEPAGWPTDLGEPQLGPANHKPKAAPKLQVSASQLRALARLARTENGGLTRSDLHADPMVVVALAKKALVTVDRSGDERAVDWIEITDAGREQAAV